MKEIIEAIKSKDNWIVAAHINPDGDAVTSLLIMNHILKNLGKDSYLFLKDGVPRRYSSLVKGETVHTDIREVQDMTDNLIVLDTATFERTGIERWDGFILNIDHHKSNAYFGDINWVDADYVAVCGMLYRLFKKLGMELNKRVAELVYAGIYVETGGFSYSNTDAEAFKIAYEIADMVDIPSLVYSIRKKRVEELKLTSKVLDTLQIINGSAIIEMRKDMVPNGDIYRSIEADDLIRFPLFLENVKVAIFLREDARRGGIRISFRSREVDVDSMARKLGGGGHPSAAGVHLSNISMERAKELVISLIKNLNTGEGSSSNR